MPSRNARLGPLALMFATACASSEPAPSPTPAPAPTVAAFVPEPDVAEPPEPEPAPEPPSEPQWAPQLDPPERGPDPWLQPGDEPWRSCADRRCRAGRFLVESVEGTRVTVRIVEVLASSEGHPNGEQLTFPSELAPLIDRQRRLRPGQTYALILAPYGMRHFRLVFVADDDEAGVAAMADIHRSPSTHENSLAWQARRRSWRGLRERMALNDAAFQVTIRAWAESDDQRRIAFVFGGGAWFVYDHQDRRIHAYPLLDDPTNITFEDGHFELWRDNRRLLTGSPFLSSLVPEAAPRIDVELAALTLADYKTPDECARQLCYGGRFVIDDKRVNNTVKIYRGHFDQVVASCPGHPNATPAESLEVYWDADHEPGDAVILLAAQHSAQRPASAVAWAPATSSAALDEARAVLTHDAAFQNDADDKKLHALFDGYRRARSRGKGRPVPIGVWATDPERRHLVTPGGSYDLRRDSVSGYIAQKSGPPGHNRVSYEGPLYTLWFNDEADLHLGG